MASSHVGDPAIRNPSLSDQNILAITSARRAVKKSNRIRQTARIKEAAAETTTGAHPAPRLNGAIWVKAPRTVIAMIGSHA
jgi:hypothetical protein